MSLPLVAVLGATGQQGGSVVNHLLKSGKFRIRALTSGSSDKAKKLAERGVEVVRVDYDSKDSLVKAFAGVWGLFQVTDPHLQNPENEKKGFTLESEQGLKVVAAAEEAKVQFAVVSVLENSEKASGGRISVPHCTQKALIEEGWRRSKVPAAFVLLGCYLQNLLTFMRPHPAADGALEFKLPVRTDIGMPMIDIDDLGIIVRALFENPKDWAGKRVDVVSEQIFWPQVAEVFSKVTGRPCRYIQLPYEVTAKFMNERVNNFFKLLNEYGAFLGRDVGVTRKRWPALKDTEAYVREHYEEFSKF